MRRGMCWAWALTLGLGIGLGGLARADEDEDDPPATAKPKGNWLTRTFSFKSAKKAAPKEKKAPEVVVAAPVIPAAVLEKKHFDEWQRRVEVCLKLREIALQTGDKDLERKEADLDQRAYETYMQKTGRLGSRSPSPDEQILEQKLDMEARRPTSLNPSAGQVRNDQAAKRSKR